MLSKPLLGYCRTDLIDDHGVEEGYFRAARRSGVNAAKCTRRHVATLLQHHSNLRTSCPSADQQQALPFSDDFLHEISSGGLTLADQHCWKPPGERSAAEIQPVTNGVLSKGRSRTCQAHNSGCTTHPRVCQDVFGPVSHTAEAASQHATSTMRAQHARNPIGCLPDTDATDPPGATQS